LSQFILERDYKHNVRTRTCICNTERSRPRGNGHGPRAGSFVKVKVIKLLELVRRRKMDEYEIFPVSARRRG
jgi:hypothetical protein